MHIVQIMKRKWNVHILFRCNIGVWIYRRLLNELFSNMLGQNIKGYTISSIKGDFSFKLNYFKNY